MIKHVIAGFLIATSAFSQVALARGDAARGKQKAEQVCAACHAVGGDWNKPLQPEYPKIAGQHYDYLTTALMLEDVILQTPIENLYFMPSGILPADAAGILNSRRMSELIADVKNRFDLVLIDSPPILGVSDASVLASEVDLTIIVIQHRKLPRNMLLRVKQAIENVGGNLLGVVLNNVDVRSDSQYQYYTSYYTYYSPTNVDNKVKPRPVAPAGQAPGARPAAAPATRGGDKDDY